MFYNQLEMDAECRTPEEPARPGLRIDGLALAALLLIFFFAGQSILERNRSEETAGGIGDGGKAPEVVTPIVQVTADPTTITYPYDNYWITQGLHGATYGHMAIDLAAGKGVEVKSPIHGQVMANYVDEYGNTTLVVENDLYRVTLLHGDYIVSAGQWVAQGQQLGSESNNGYTVDMQGRSCRGRDCGHHTHLNIFNKKLQRNVNPLDVLQQAKGS